MLLAVALMCLATLGCQKRIEYVYLQPECTAPPMPSGLPVIDAEYVFNRLGVEVTEKLILRERLIVDSLMEHRAMLKEICEADNDG